MPQFVAANLNHYRWNLLCAYEDDSWLIFELFCASDGGDRDGKGQIYPDRFYGNIFGEERK